MKSAILLSFPNGPNSDCIGGHHLIIKLSPEMATCVAPFYMNRDYHALIFYMFNIVELY